MTILLVEDRPDARKTTAEILRLSGYKVRTAANYVEAKEQLTKQCPEVLVIDLGLPCGRKGSELLNEPCVQERWETIKVVIASAYLPTDSQVQSIGNLPPHSAIITKPFKVKDLVALIEQSLHHVGGVP